MEAHRWFEVQQAEMEAGRAARQQAWAQRSEGMAAAR
jgi:hypothetical protein